MRRHGMFGRVLLPCALLLVSAPALAGTMIVDGDWADWDPPDWTFDPPPYDNLGHIARNPGFQGQYIWRDAPGDERTDFAAPDSRVDLVELRLTGDLANVYILARFRDIPSGAVAGDGAPMLQVAVSTPSMVVPSNWFAGFADTWVPPEAAWSFLIQTRFGGAVAGSPDLAAAPVMLYTTGGGSGLHGLAVISAQHDAIEISIPWAAFGLAGPPEAPALLTAATFRANPADDTWDIGGPNASNALDAVTHYGDPGLAMENTWREVEDMDVDYHFQVWFGRMGEVAAPLVLHEVFYDPAGPDPALEYVELVNQTPAPLLLRGYKLGDAELPDLAGEGMAVLDCGTVLPFGSLVVASSADEFRAFFGFAPDYSLAPTALAVPVALPYDLWAVGSVALGDAGDELLVLDPYDTVIDLALFEAPPWPAHAGEGFEAAEGQMMWRFQLADTNDMLADFMPIAPSPAPELCGNGITECLEACDDGALNGATPCGCQADCSLPADGDPCEDGLWCNGAETCGGGLCNPGPAPCGATQLCSEASDQCIDLAGSLVVNEVDYDQAGADGGEFIELKNVSGVALELGAFEVRLANGGGGGGVYATFALPDALLAPDGYFVLCANPANVPNCDLDVAPDTNLIQNGNPDAIGVFFGGAVVDAVSYGGDTWAPYTETSGVGLLDSTTAMIGISRYPDGVDTEVNNVDLSQRCISPGLPNRAATANCQCGNGLPDPGEACDDGADNGASLCGCQLDCQWGAASTPCPDGLWCNGDETCDGAGGCQAGVAPVCVDGVACTVDGCDEAADACAYSPDDGLCEDELACNGAETCDAASGCLPGVPPDCDDGVGCTQDACSEAAGGCVHTPQDAACDDGDDCTAEHCDLVAGCVFAAVVCDDGVDCTLDGCDPASGCVFVAEDAACDDGNACTADHCDQALGCQHAALDGVPCGLATACAGAPQCSAGVCMPGEPVVCDDGVGCTLDGCDEAAGGCVFSADDSACDDSEFCSGQEFCDPLLGCLAGMGVMCDDGVGCTLDACDEDLDQCVSSVDDGACDDGLACNGAEICDPEAGCQAGAPVDCSGLDGACAQGVCEEATGACVAQPVDDGTACDDGDACTAGDTCGAGACQGALVDGDGDGYGPGAACGGDCDDTDGGVHPGAQEICGDDIDQDCSGADLQCGCADADGDGHQDEGCGGDDCDDTDGGVHPGAQEICGDGVDQDCSGADLQCGCADADGDGHQDAACGGTDCDDLEAGVNPAADELCADGVDNDCDGLVDSQDVDDCGVPSTGCGCGASGSPGGAGLLTLGLGLAVLLRRRRR